MNISENNGALNRQTGLERLNLSDIMQVTVGSFTGALVFIMSSEIVRISDKVPFINLLIIIVISVFFSYAISYMIGVRRLGKKKMRLFLGLVPQRTILQYFSSVFFSFSLLYLLNINTATTSMDLVFSRTVVLSMPSTITASAADLIESQKEAPKL